MTDHFNTDYADRTILSDLIAEVCEDAASTGMRTAAVVPYNSNGKVSVMGNFTNTCAH